MVHGLWHAYFEDQAAIIAGRNSAAHDHIRGRIAVAVARAVLEIEQLRDVTMNDPELMREILGALVDDTSHQLELLETAIRQQDSNLCQRSPSRTSTSKPVISGFGPLKMNRLSYSWA